MKCVFLWKSPQIKVIDFLKWLQELQYTPVQALDDAKKVISWKEELNIEVSKQRTQVFLPLLCIEKGLKYQSELNFAMFFLSNIFWGVIATLQLLSLPLEQFLCRLGIFSSTKKWNKNGLFSSTQALALENLKFAELGLTTAFSLISLYLCKNFVSVSVSLFTFYSWFALCVDADENTGMTSTLEQEFWKKIAAGDAEAIMKTKDITEAQAKSLFSAQFSIAPEELADEFARAVAAHQGLFVFHSLFLFQKKL